MTKTNIGLIGLGTMGAMLALNIAEKGFRISVFNRTTATTRAFVKNAGELADMITPCETLEELIGTIEKPRAIILMVPAGPPVDEQIAALRPLLMSMSHVLQWSTPSVAQIILRTSSSANSISSMSSNKSKSSFLACFSALDMS